MINQNVAQIKRAILVKEATRYTRCPPWGQTNRVGTMIEGMPSNDGASSFHVGNIVLPSR